MTPDANALDVERLREIAGKATPGDWPVETWYGSMDGGFAAVGPHHLTPDGESDEPGGVAETRALADARFIATFNPTTALALLSRLDALEAEVVKLRRVKDSAVRALGLLGEHGAECPANPYGPLYGDIPAHCNCAYGALDTALAALAPSDSSAKEKA